MSIPASHLAAAAAVPTVQCEGAGCKPAAVNVRSIERYTIDSHGRPVATGEFEDIEYGTCQVCGDIAPTLDGLGIITRHARLDVVAALDAGYFGGSF